MFANEVRHKIIDSGITIQKLAYLLGITQSSLSQRLKKDNLTESQLIEMADMLGCDVELRLVPKKDQKEILDKYKSYSREDWKRIEYENLRR